MRKILPSGAGVGMFSPTTWQPLMEMPPWLDCWHVWRLYSPSILPSKLTSVDHRLPHPAVVGNDSCVMASKRGVHSIPLPARERRCSGENGGHPEIVQLAQSAADP